MDDATTNQAAIDPLLELAAENEVTISEQGYSEFLANRDLQYDIIRHLTQWAQGGQWMFERLLFEEEKKYIILYRSEEGNIERVSTYSRKRVYYLLTANNLSAATCCQDGGA